MTDKELEKKREKARLDYRRGMSLRDIARKYDVEINTIKTWRSRYGWAREKNPFLGNQYAKGNRGGAPKGNTNRAQHGLFTKFIPEETLEAMEALIEKDPLDILWDQIRLQYAAILRSQSIMFVQSKDELVKIESRIKEGDFKEIQYEIQFAWDRQATFLNAQSRAMAELRSTIRQYVDMTYDDDERKMKLRLMQANLRKVKAEIKRLKAEIQNFGVEEEERTVIVSNEDEMRKVLEKQKDDNNKEEETDE